MLIQPLLLKGVIVQKCISLSSQTVFLVDWQEVLGLTMEGLPSDHVALSS